MRRASAALAVVTALLTAPDTVLAAQESLAVSAEAGKLDRSSRNCQLVLVALGLVD